MKNFPLVTAADWRAQVEAELAGASFDKALVFKTPEGLKVGPLYSELKVSHAVAPNEPFRVCMRHAPTAGVKALLADLDNGAKALWIHAASLPELDARDAFFIVEGRLPATLRADLRFAVLADAFDPSDVMEIAQRYPHGRALISTIRDHDAGADMADELGIALSTGAAMLESLLGVGMGPSAAARHIAVQISVGRDTFGELCKLRALRVCWQKFLAASGVNSAEPLLVHAVCSSRTLTQRDPWVNMLRGTTQVFAAVLGGADLVTPLPFDSAFGPPSALAHRVARNTGLVLGEESALGKVVDPASGSYYLETLTDELAREAWRRFQSFEKDGGIRLVRSNGQLQARLDASWKSRLDSLSKRKEPVLGVSDFANLSETLPGKATVDEQLRRDAQPFEQVRLEMGKKSQPLALLRTLGSMAESRARVAFAQGFFGAGGIATREVTEDETARVVCLCGTDERYAAEAVARVRALKAAGCQRVLLAGRPGVLESALREAGIDGFIFMGCDVVESLRALIEVFS